jgi:hypothetical protein
MYILLFKASIIQKTTYVPVVTVLSPLCTYVPKGTHKMLMKLTPGVKTGCEMFVLLVSGRKFNLDFFSQFHIITKKSLSDFRLPIPDADSIPVVATDKSGKTKAEVLSKVSARGLIINDFAHVILL